MFAVLTPSQQPALVFVAACDSELVGRAFAAAGVRHVVAVEMDKAVVDTHATSCIGSFYYNLFHGKSVRHAFDMATAAQHVKHSQTPVQRMPSGSPYTASPFCLLPVDRSHDVRVD